MEYFLQFIYFGEVNVPAAALDNLIRVARELGIKGRVTDFAPVISGSLDKCPVSSRLGDHQ